MYIPQWMEYAIYSLAALAFLLAIKCIIDASDAESEASHPRGRTRRRRRAGMEVVCPGCETIMWYLPTDEEARLLVSRDCVCLERDFRPGYGARAQLPRYTEGDMAPPYEPYASL